MTNDDVKRIINANKAILEKYKVKNIALFGSYQKNEHTPASDIDFLVEFSEPISIFKHVNLIYELESLFGKKVEVVTKNTLKPRIKDTILKEAMQL